jgi:hypothetical protein
MAVLISNLTLRLDDLGFIGELAPDGTVRPVAGLICGGSGLGSPAEISLAQASIRQCPLGGRAIGGRRARSHTRRTPRAGRSVRATAAEPDEEHDETQR